MTQPDITHAMHVVSQFMHAPCTTHLHTVKRIFHYLHGTLAHGMWVQPSAASPSLVIAYFDAHWARCKDSCRSTTGYAVFRGPHLIAWHSKKQPTISIEVEYKAIGYTIAVGKLLYDLGNSPLAPVHLYCDNLNATYMSANPMQHDRSKHIALDYHFVRKRVADGDLVIRYIPTRL